MKIAIRNTEHGIRTIAQMALLLLLLLHSEHCHPRNFTVEVAIRTIEHGILQLERERESWR